MMLTIFRGLSLNIVNIEGHERYYMTPLNPVQIRVLMLLGFSQTIYHELSEKLAIKMSERRVHLLNNHF